MSSRLALTRRNVAPHIYESREEARRALQICLRSLRTGDRFDQILVQGQKPPDRPGDFGNQLNMQDPVGDVVVLYQIKDLGFVDVAGVGQGVQDPVHIQRKGLSIAAGACLGLPSAALGAHRGQGRQIDGFALVERPAEVEGCGRPRIANHQGRRYTGHVPAQRRVNLLPRIRDITIRHCAVQLQAGQYLNVERPRLDKQAVGRPRRDDGSHHAQYDAR